MALAKIYLLFSNISSLCEAFVKLKLVIIPVTCRVKGYTRFVGRYVRRKRFRPHKVYIAEGNVSDPIKYISF